jgi:hypothetical protein
MYSYDPLRALPNGVYSDGERTYKFRMVKTALRSGWKTSFDFFIDSLTSNLQPENFSVDSKNRVRNRDKDVVVFYPFDALSAGFLRDWLNTLFAKKNRIVPGNQEIILTIPEGVKPRVFPLRRA